MSRNRVKNPQALKMKFVYNTNADNAYKMIGNAVPVPLAYEIAVAIRNYLD